MGFATLLLQEAKKRNTVQSTLHNQPCNASLTNKRKYRIDIIKYITYKISNINLY